MAPSPLNYTPIKQDDTFYKPVAHALPNEAIYYSSTPLSNDFTSKSELIKKTTKCPFNENTQMFMAGGILLFLLILFIRR